jgi:hypothetical protein
VPSGPGAGLARVWRFAAKSNTRGNVHTLRRGSHKNTYSSNAQQKSTARRLLPEKGESIGRSRYSHHEAKRNWNSEQERIKFNDPLRSGRVIIHAKPLGTGAGVVVDCSAPGCRGSVAVPTGVPGLCTSSLALRGVVFSNALWAGSDCSTTGRTDGSSTVGSETGADVGSGIGSSASEELFSFFASGGVVVMRSREVYAKGKQVSQSTSWFR